MKRVFIILMLFVITTLSGGCDVIFKESSDNSDVSQSEKVSTLTAPQIMFDKIIFALDNKDTEGLEDLFALNALTAAADDIDNQVTEVMEFYKGKFVSNTPFDTGASLGHKEFTTWTYLTLSPNIRELKTTETVYSLSFNSVPVDDENPDDIGLWGIWLRIMDGDTIISECQVGTPYPGRANELDE